jgi:hypothetical protein
MFHARGRSDVKLEIIWQECCVIFYVDADLYKCIALTVDLKSMLRFLLGG